jgi:hypothetical protein
MELLFQRLAGIIFVTIGENSWAKLLTLQFHFVTLSLSHFFPQSICQAEGEHADGQAGVGI